MEAATADAIRLAALHAAPRPTLVVLTGAGISAESGLRTYRGPDGLYSDGDLGEPVLHATAIEQAVRRCTAFWAVGTSGVVMPAAAAFDHVVLGRAAETVPAAVDVLLEACGIGP